ncbi:phosphoadenosine phosphosulfate reductase family protein [Candidatus Hodgkinia cicadicola]
MFSCLERIDWSLYILSLDTNRLFCEVRMLLGRLRLTLGKRCFVCYPSECFVLCSKRLFCGFSIYSNIETRLMCCKIRKVYPLFRSVFAFGIKLWITGVRRLQSESRETFCVVQYDSKFDCIKFNPVLVWKAGDLAKLMAGRLIERNCLLDLGYKSVGCEPCTKKTKRCERARAGRWWWERALNVGAECGLHIS